MWRVWSLVVAALLQEQRLPGPPPPGLDASPAGAIVRRAIEAHGGWDVWRSRETAQYRLAITELGPGGIPSGSHRERHQMVLRGPPRVRIDIDSSRVWILADGEMRLEESEKRSDAAPAVAQAARQAEEAYRLFRLPFGLAEPGVTLTLVGERVRAQWPPAQEGEEGPWVEATFSKSGLLESVFFSQRSASGEAFFLVEFQYGEWISGILKERQRLVYAADRAGKPLRRISEVAVEDVRFDEPVEITLSKGPLP